MQRAYRSGVAVKLGPFFMVHLDVVNAKESAKSLFRQVCPDCTDGVATKRQNICPKDATHGPYTDGELAKAIPVGKDKLEKVDDDDLAAIFGSFPNRILDLKVCRSGEFVGKTLPSANIYRLRPSGKVQDTAAYALLKELVENTNHTFYGKLKMDDSANPQPFVLQVWEDQLLIQQLVPPANVHETDDIPVEPIPQKHMEMGQQLVESLIEPFDGDYLTDERIERVNQILAAKRAGEPVVIAETPVASGDDLMAMLQASLEANKK